MTVQSWPLRQIVVYARNARKIGPSAIDKVAASIREFGWRQPIVVDTAGVIVVGHARYLAAQKLGLTEVPVHVAEGLTSAQVRAYRLMDNRSHEEASWDVSLLGAELLELKDLEFDLQFTGFNPIEADRLIADLEEDSLVDRIPDVPGSAVTQPGDLWVCGSHRVLCGDATASQDVATLLGRQPVPLMVTDPPYGVNYDPNWREQAGLGRLRQVGQVANDGRVNWKDAYHLFPGDVAYVWHAGIHAVEVAGGLEAAGFQIRGQMVWAKQHFALSRGHYHWQHEPCWYAIRKDRPSHWRGDRTQSTLWEVANLNPFGGNAQEAATGHGTQKPVELMRKPILNHLERGEVVYDPFLGSGSTLIAAHSTERVCYGLEIDPHYVDVIVQRWQQVSGGEARLERDGRPFEPVLGEGSNHAETIV